MNTERKEIGRCGEGHVLDMNTIWTGAKNKAMQKSGRHENSKNQRKLGEMHLNKCENIVSNSPSTNKTGKKWNYYLQR